MRGDIFNIQRFSIQDGPGIRTNIFFKGCPLRSAWCHNPEGLLRRRQLSFLREKCALCGACADVCPTGAHVLRGGAHDIRREACRACGACAEACAYGALEIVGKQLSVEEIVAVVKRDAPFYGDTGGATLTGGEPMAQPEFALALASALRADGVGVCVETSCYCAPETLRAIAPFVDFFLFDIKETDPALHKQYTGVSNELILSNLFLLDALGARLILRCPLIPGVNDRNTHMEAVAELANALKGANKIELEPYHPLGVSKAERIGGKTSYGRSAFMEKAEALALANVLREKTARPVVVR